MARSTKQLIRALEKKKEELAVLRDHLREIEDEAESLRERADDAFGSLEYAIDRLSELV